MKKILTYLGDVTLFIKDLLPTFSKISKSLNLIWEQVYYIGVGSLLIVIATSFFAGAVTAHQAAFQGRDYLPEIYIGMSVIKAFMIELAPILTALVVGGRCGSSMTAELGAMRITEQIDALETLAVDPMRYLVLPRFIGATIALPLLTVISLLMGCVGGGFCAVVLMNIKPSIYTAGLSFDFQQHVLWGGLFKSLVFGMVIGLLGSFHGFTASGGTEGVGKATTRAVVSIFILIIILDFIVAKLVF